MAGEFNNLKIRIMQRLAVEKKKAFVALFLVSIMVFMWVKLLTGHGPQSATATINNLTKTSEDSKNEDNKLVFIELPFEEGRHDVLVRDFFSIENAVFSQGQQANIVSSQGDKQNIRTIADKLRLEAVSMAPEPEAFINDRLVKNGDVLKVTDKEKEFECEIVEIDGTKVLVKCGKAEIELKLKQSEEF